MNLSLTDLKSHYLNAAACYCFSLSIAQYFSMIFVSCTCTVFRIL
jgi:hypothetical protein